jgi:hypothetical protein
LGLCPYLHDTPGSAQRSLWQIIEGDRKKHKTQYNDEHHSFLDKIWAKRWDILWNEPESA